MRAIVALSGGKASAWCADWAFRNFAKEDVVLYFNDTKWEHEDLYRFLDDLSRHFDHPVTFDSDGRSVEQLFYDHNALANNRMPFCSRILKAERLQKFYKDGDTIIFGIGCAEAHRARRISEVYAEYSRRKKKWPKLRFPLIGEQIGSEAIDQFLTDAGIDEPLLYRLGFKHNNCSGGCVRSGKGQWLHLLNTLPDVYAERERVERELSEHVGKECTFMKTISLKQLREMDESQLKLNSIFDDEEATDCIGICSHMA